MWIQIICGGVIIYKLYKSYFYDNDVSEELNTTNTDAVFSVANRLEKLYGGKAHVGLRIPDADTGSRQKIDIVLVTEGELKVFSVKNFSGFVTISEDGSWACEGEGRPKAECHPDPVAEAKQQASILDSYLEQRGVTLPNRYLSYKIVLPNPKFRTIDSSCFPPEVITYDQWAQLKPEPHQELNYILSRSPMWDRLEYKSNKYVLGEFLKFKGTQEDTMALRDIKRSKVSHLLVKKKGMHGSAHVLYSPRDYRTDGDSTSKLKEITLRSSVEVLFQPENSTKARKFELSSIVSLSLSA